jgi:membrane protein
MNLWSLLRETAASWIRHQAPRMGAALAYYAVLSIAPLIVLAIAIAGFAFNEQLARGGMLDEVRDTVGDPGARVIESILKNAHNPTSGKVATLLGILTLFVGASGVFVELQDALNTIWEVPANPKASGIPQTIRYYVLSFAMILAIGFILLASLILSTCLDFFAHWLSGIVPWIPSGAGILNAIVSFAVISILFALIFKFLPNARIDWTDVLHGALATSFLFTLGKALLAFYIGRMSVGNAYGAAGSFVAMLVWVYYSAQIFFFGAEFTHVYAKHRHPIKPAIAP